MEKEPTSIFRLGSTGISRVELIELLETDRPLRLDETASKGMAISFETLEGWRNENMTIYGVSAGIGDLATRSVDKDWQSTLQLDLIRSHTCGLGPPVPERIVRGAMILRSATLARGYSGVRASLVERLLEMVNRSVIPVVPRNGSVGASGDTVLLAHIAAVLIGEGQACFAGGPVCSGRSALTQAGLAPFELHPREGLALLNGLDITLSLAACLARETGRIFEFADRVAALAADALCASPEPFLAQVQSLRGPGAHNRVASNLMSQVRDSDWIGTAQSPQDPYCIRCIPPVHGASWEVLHHTEEVIDLELEAVIDNPLIIPGEEGPRHCGHFHGQRIAMASDYLAIALVNSMNISHSRISLLLSGHESLPPMLAIGEKVANGLMATQTCSASTLARARAATTPVSIQSIHATAL